MEVRAHRGVGLRRRAAGRTEARRGSAARVDLQRTRRRGADRPGRALAGWRPVRRTSGRRSALGSRHLRHERRGGRGARRCGRDPASGPALRRALAVHTVVGEEDGGLGTYATLRRGHRGDACVIAEPTAGAIIPANAGALTFRLEIIGRATHGSTRTRGVSAIEKFELITTALRGLERDAQRHGRRRGSPISTWPGRCRSASFGPATGPAPSLTGLVAEGRFGVIAGRAARRCREARSSPRWPRACRIDPWLAEHPVVVTLARRRVREWIAPRRPPPAR